jgi:3,4-dihydroxy-2-butanone 4-phosphate synthase
MLTRRQLLTAHILADYLTDQQCMNDVLADLEDYAKANNAEPLTGSDIVNLLQVTQDLLQMPAKQPKVVIEVSGGVAECTLASGANVVIVDHDNPDIEGEMIDASHAVAAALHGTLSREVLDGLDCDDMLDAGKEWLGEDHPAVQDLAEMIELFEAV